MAKTKTRKRVTCKACGRDFRGQVGLGNHNCVPRADGAKPQARDTREATENHPAAKYGAAGIAAYDASVAAHVKRALERGVDASEAANGSHVRATIAARTAHLAAENADGATRGPASKRGNKPAGEEPQAPKSKAKPRVTSGRVDAASFPAESLCDKNGRPLRGNALAARVAKLERERVEVVNVPVEGEIAEVLAPPAPDTCSHGGRADSCGGDTDDLTRDYVTQGDLAALMELFESRMDLLDARFEDLAAREYASASA